MSHEPPASADDGNYHCGHVALVGRPNVGKSTLLNQIIGQKVSIVTAKPQTTRQRVAGIKTTHEGQVVYLDTPGIHWASKRALNRYMNRIARAALHDVDLVLFLVEAGRWTKQDAFAAQIIRESAVPVFLVVNKIDRIADKTRLLAFLKEEVDTTQFDSVLLISAKSGDGVADLEARILRKLPFSRPLFDEDDFTDRSERFLAAELIREQLMLGLHQEVPYALTVEIEEFRRDPRLLRIGAVIWVERESQKQIVIGKDGQTLKRIAARARIGMERLFEQKVFLRTWVKLSRDWSNDEQAMQKLGFDD